MNLLRIAAWILGALGFLLAGGVTVGGCVFAGSVWRGPKTDHFDGEVFKNQTEGRRQGVGQFLKWMTNRDQGPWTPVNDDPGPPPPERVSEGKVRVTWVGHATVLVQMDGLNLLTDPIWSDRASPVSFAGPKRMHPPGLRFEDLPPIDAVLVSHNHYDHLDLETLARLHQAHRPRFFVGLGNAALLDEAGIDNVAEVDWWDAVPLSDSVTVHSVPVQHFSGRGLTDRAKTLWTGYVVESPSGPVFFAGDTGWGPHFEQIAERFGPVRLAMLPIGAYLPRWFMAPVHISPTEALRAHWVLRARTSLAMHYGTFPLGDDGQNEAPDRLAEALERSATAGQPARFWMLGFGEGREVP